MTAISLLSRKVLFAVALAVVLALRSVAASAEEPIRVGILHSTTGTMAISEGVLRETVLMLIEEQNARGGLLGKALEPVVYDPRSNWGLYAQQARRMIERDSVQVIFGCWTSASRKAVLPVLEQLDGLLFYPVQYEGQESSRNIIYTGAVPNQQALPAIDFLRARGVERWILAGTDYVYPRTTNRILTAYLASLGVAEGDILLHYTPFGFENWEEPVRRFARFADGGKKTAIVSTINGDANIAFYNELGSQDIRAAELPVMAFSVGEQEISGIAGESLEGHFATWGYFMTLDTPENHRFLEKWRTYTGDPGAIASDPVEAHVIGFRLWVQAVEKAGTTEPAAVREALVGLQERNLGGMTVSIRDNHHIDKQALVGRMSADGTLSIISTSPVIPAQPWSEFVK